MNESDILTAPATTNLPAPGRRDVEAPVGTAAGAVNSTLLLPGQRERFEHCKRVCHEKLEAALEFAVHLATIRDERLYREDFDTFEEFCQTEFGMAARSIRRLIAQGDILQVLAKEQNGSSTSAFLMPAYPTQVEPLIGLPQEHWAAVWAEACAGSPGGRPTVKRVKAAVDAYKERHGLKSNAQSPMSKVGDGLDANRPPSSPALLPQEKVASESRAQAPVVVDVKPIGGRVEELGLKLDQARKLVRELSDMPGAPVDVKAALTYLDNAGKAVGSVERQLAYKDAAHQARCDDTIRRIKSLRTATGAVRQETTMAHQ